VAVQQAALVSDESALEACLRQCAIQIDDLYLLISNSYPLPNNQYYWIMPIPISNTDTGTMCRPADGVVSRHNTAE